MKLHKVRLHDGAGVPGAWTRAVVEHLYQHLWEVCEFGMQALGDLDDLVLVLIQNCLEEEEDVVVTAQLNFHIQRVSLISLNNKRLII